MPLSPQHISKANTQSEHAAQSVTSASRGAYAPHGFWFGEDQARYVLAVAAGAAMLAKAKAAGVPARLIGAAGGGDLVLPDGTAISIGKLASAHEATLPALMGEK